MLGCFALCLMCLLPWWLCCLHLIIYSRFFFVRFFSPFAFSWYVHIHIQRWVVAATFFSYSYSHCFYSSNLLWLGMDSVSLLSYLLSYLRTPFTGELDGSFLGFHYANLLRCNYTVVQWLRDVHIHWLLQRTNTPRVRVHILVPKPFAATKLPPRPHRFADSTNHFDCLPHALSSDKPGYEHLCSSLNMHPVPNKRHRMVP